MPTMNTQARNILAEVAGRIFDAIDIRTSGGGTTLAELTGITFGIPAAGAIAMSATVTDSSANDTGTAAEARIKHTNGAGTGYLVNDGGDTLAVGDVAIPVDTGSGNLEVGDIIRFAGDSQDYMVIQQLTGAGTLYIFPGLKADPGDGAAITSQTAPEISGLTVGTSGSDINLNSVSVDSGEQVDLTAFTYTQPAS